MHLTRANTADTRADVMRAQLLHPRDAVPSLRNVALD